MLENTDQIANVMRVIPLCWFDIEKCERGLASLDSYRKEWNERLAVYRDRPLDDWAADGADAFAVFASAHQFMWDHSGKSNMVLSPGTVDRETKLNKTSKGWT